MHRFFSANSNFTEKIIDITSPDEIHHIRHVLRLRKEQDICIFNGKGEEVEGTILEITNQQIKLRINKLKNISSDKRTSLVLACAIPKKAKFELIIEKCTELGIDEIIPLQTKRTEVKLEGEKAKKKRVRYQSVAINAAKQSKRLTVPTIHPLTKFSNLLGTLDKTTLAFIPCLEGERQRLIEAFKIKKSHKRIIFFIGPEGDFTPAELEQAKSTGCIPITLGPQTLKVDTAAITAIAAANLLAS